MWYEIYRHGYFHILRMYPSIHLSIHSHNTHNDGEESESESTMISSKIKWNQWHSCHHKKDDTKWNKVNKTKQNKTYVMWAGSSLGVLKVKQNSSDGARVTDKVARDGASSWDNDNKMSPKLKLKLLADDRSFIFMVWQLVMVVQGPQVMDEINHDGNDTVWRKCYCGSIHSP